MDNSTPFYAYKETRLDLDPTTQGSTISILLPTHTTSIISSRTAQKRSQTLEVPIAEDETTFRRKHLATAASIYHRTHHKSPRSFLWRVLEDGKVLSIRAVDVCKASNSADANIVLRLAFPSTIVPGCIALSDSKEHDILNVFVYTESKHLYTLSLRPDHFRKPSSTEDNVDDWCKSYTGSAFTFKHPLRLAALSADQLLISVHDGSLIRLDKNSGGDGSVWKETHHSDATWGHGLRSIISLRGGNSVSYGGQNVQLSAATSIAAPSAVIDSVEYAFMISLDHRLRVWNLAMGKQVYMGDLLTQEADAQEEVKKVIDPSQSQLVKVVGDNDESALCVTFSPLGSGQFKFWNAIPVEGGNLELIDLFPDNTLVPPTPTSEIWTLADFSVLDRPNAGNYTLWVLWKNNVTYRLHKLDFQSGSAARVRDAWTASWQAMASETLRETPLPVVFPGDPSDVTDKWLGFILSPGRFTGATVETGLAIYARGLGNSKGSTRKTGSLPERMCATIASTASLGRTSDGSMDYEQFRTATDAQWRRFYRLLLELDKQRGEAMSLVIDPQGEIPWVVLADGITAIRNCSDLEKVWQNNGMVPSGAELVARPLFAAASFRDSFSEQFMYRCETALLEEIFQDPSLTEPARMRAFYDKCDFSNQIGDEEYSQLVAGLGGNFKNVTRQTYEALLELMTASEDIDNRDHFLPLAEYGNKMVLKGVQETSELHRTICLDQLILLVLIEGEVNHTDEGIKFDTATVFSQLMLMLTRLALVSWLANTQISLPIKQKERSNSITDKATSPTRKPAPKMETVTVLEGVLRHLLGFDSRTDETMSSVLTKVILQICAPESDFEAPAAVIQCFLLKHDRADLAIDLSRFANHDPFSIYVQGRSSLAANDPNAASMHFKKAAFGMAYPNAMKGTDHRSAGYLDDTEKRLLNVGLPEYYSHIVALYDKEKIYSFVIDFARLSLQFMDVGREDFQDAQLRTEMHSRLFNAAIQTTRFELAHSTLVLFTDVALQQSSLRTLITKMCESSYATQLIELPFISLQDQADEILAQKCQSIVDVTIGVPYHKILYAWRIKRSDFRGAAAISLERLQRLQQSGDGDRNIEDDVLETPVTKQYVALINALSCVDPKQAWILSEELPKKGNSAGKITQPKRKVVTLADVRRNYQEELDRIAAIQNNQFAFGGDEMDVL